MTARATEQDQAVCNSLTTFSKNTLGKLNTRMRLMNRQKSHRNTRLTGPMSKQVSKMITAVPAKWQNWHTHYSHNAVLVLTFHTFIAINITPAARSNFFHTSVN